MSVSNNAISKVRLLMLGAPLILAACCSDFGPFPMPTGYHYHNDTYKTPPGPEPVFDKIKHMNDPQSTENCPDGEAQAAPGMVAAPVTAPPPAPVEASSPALDAAAADLVGRLVDQFGRPVEPVYISPSAGTSQEMALEKSLRDTLKTQGFNVAPAPGMGPYTLDYTIRTPDSVGGRSLVKIMLAGRKGVVSEQSGLYDLGAPGIMQAAPPPVVMSAAPPAPAEPPVSQGAPLPIGPSE